MEKSDYCGVSSLGDLRVACKRCHINGLESFEIDGIEFSVAYADYLLEYAKNLPGEALLDQVFPCWNRDQ